MKRRLLTALVMGLMSLIWWAGPAQAADELQLSNDGVTWTDAVQPLFADAIMMVPGDTVADVVYVRNNSLDAAHVFLYQAEDAVAAPDPQAGSEFRVGVRDVTGLSEVAMASGPGCQVVYSAGIQPGEVRRLATSVTLPWSSTNASQRAVLEPQITISLGQGELSTAATPCPGISVDPEQPDSTSKPGASPGGQSATTVARTELTSISKSKSARKKSAGLSLDGLPKTGAERVGPWIIAGTLAVVGGWFLICVKRKREDEEAEGVS